MCMDLVLVESTIIVTKQFDRQESGQEPGGEGAHCVQIIIEVYKGALGSREVC